MTQGRLLGDDVADRLTPAPQRSQLGDVWEVGDHVLFVGSATTGAGLERLCRVTGVEPERVEGGGGG